MICFVLSWFSNSQGASVVHFQDQNAESIRCKTIPNVLANLEQARDRQSRQPESPLTPSRQILSPSVHFYAGDWEELPAVLSVVKNDGYEVTPGMSLSFSEEDFMDGCSSQEGSIVGHESTSRRSRKLSGSRAWERASEADQGEGGYDVILMTEIPCSVSTLKKLYALIKKVWFLLLMISYAHLKFSAVSTIFVSSSHDLNDAFLLVVDDHTLISKFYKSSLLCGWVGGVQFMSLPSLYL